MNIAIMSHDNRKDLMVQFCTAYAGILSQHNLYATNTTGHMVAEATGLKVHCFLSYAHGGSQQIGARIGTVFQRPQQRKDGRRDQLHLPPVRPEQCALCQQHCHGGNAGTGSGPG